MSASKLSQVIGRIHFLMPGGLGSLLLQSQQGEQGPRASLKAR